MDTPDAAIGRLAACQHGAIAHRQARELSLTKAMIAHRRATGRWLPAARGVSIVTGAPATPLRDVMVAVLGAGPGAVASHGTAAWLWGLADRTAPIHVSGPRRVRIPGVVLHRTTPDDIVEIDGIPVTGLVRTLIDVAAQSADVEVMVDAALRRRLIAFEPLRTRFAELRGRGHPGSATLGEIIAVRDPAEAVPDSVLEREFERLLVAAGLPRPVRQYPIRDGAKVVAVVDHAYVDERIAMWVDGYSFHDGRRAFDRDAEQLTRVAALGWTPLRFTSTDIQRRPRTVPTRVARVLGSRPMAPTDDPAVRERRPTG